MQKLNLQAVVALALLGVACTAEDEGRRAEDAGIEAEAGQQLTCGVPVVHYVNGAASDALTALTACFGASEGSAPRVDLTAAPVCSDLAEPCVPGGANAACEHKCQADNDCETGELCTCIMNVGASGLSVHGNSFRGNRCVPANCTSAADCGGYACGMTHHLCQYANGFYCRTANDTCESDLDCPEHWQCQYQQEEGAWGCGPRAGCD